MTLGMLILAIAFGGSVNKYPDQPIWVVLTSIFTAGWVASMLCNMYLREKREMLDKQRNCTCSSVKDDASSHPDS